MARNASGSMTHVEAVPGQPFFKTACKVCSLACESHHALMQDISLEQQLQQQAAEQVTTLSSALAAANAQLAAAQRDLADEQDTCAALNLSLAAAEEHARSADARAAAAQEGEARVRVAAEQAQARAQAAEQQAVELQETQDKLQTAVRGVNSVIISYTACFLIPVLSYSAKRLCMMPHMALLAGFEPRLRLAVWSLVYVRCPACHPRCASLRAVSQRCVLSLSPSAARPLP